jgi:hypothetical protein
MKSSKKISSKYFIPQWMSDDVAHKAKNMGSLARIEMAEKLERAANELRNFKQPYVKFIGTAHVLLRPNAKKAILYFADIHGANGEDSEQDRLDIGARWFLEEALCLIQKISDLNDVRVLYRNAEDLEDSAHTNTLIGTALERFIASNSTIDSE